MVLYREPHRPSRFSPRASFNSATFQSQSPCKSSKVNQIGKLHTAIPAQKKPTSEDNQRTASPLFRTHGFNPALQQKRDVSPAPFIRPRFPQSCPPLQQKNNRLPSPGIPGRSAGIDAAFSDFASPSSSRVGSQVPKASHVRVVARIRPLNVTEMERGCTECVVSVPSQHALGNQSNMFGSTPSPNEKSNRKFNMDENIGSYSGSKLCKSPVISLNLHRDEYSRIGPNLSCSEKDNTSSPSNLMMAAVTPVASNSDTNARCVDAGITQHQEFVSTSLTAGITSKKKFNFDAVFGPHASQREVYERSVGDAVRRNIFRGFNTTIMTYGQTGSGKTFTMTGVLLSEADSANSKSLEQIKHEVSKANDTGEKKTLPPLEDSDGIMARAVNDLFKGRTMHPGSVTIKLTYIELYNDEIRDVLADPDKKNEVEIKDFGKDGIACKNLTRLEVSSPEHVAALLQACARRRMSGSTVLNENSSRSHIICTFHVTIAPPPLGQSTTDESSAKGNITSLISTETIYAKLTLVDLAGAEKIKVTKTEGNQQRESISINKDLMVLGKVVLALSEQRLRKTSSRHIPYRDSKLTRLLRHSLGGNCCTVMIACISPSSDNLEESVNTLRYAQRTREITNSVTRNIVKKTLTPADAIMLRRENKNLRLQLAEAVEKLKKLENSVCTCRLSSIGIEDEPNSDAKSLRIQYSETLGEVASMIDTLFGHNLGDKDYKVRLETIAKIIKDKISHISTSSHTELNQKGIVPSSLEGIATELERRLPPVSTEKNKDSYEERETGCDFSFSSHRMRGLDDDGRDDCDIAADDDTLDSSCLFVRSGSISSTMESTSNSLLHEIAAKQILRDELEDEEFALREKVAALSTEYEEIKKQVVIARNKKENDAVVDKEYGGCNEINSVVEERERLEKKRDKVKEDIGILTKEKKLLISEVEEYQQVAEIMEQLNEEKEQNATYEKDLSELRRELEEATTEAKKLREDNRKKRKKSLIGVPKSVECVDYSGYESKLSDDDDEASATTMDSRSIREHAEKVLNMAERAISKKDICRPTGPKAPLPLYGEKSSLRRVAVNRKNNANDAGSSKLSSKGKEEEMTSKRTPITQHKTICNRPACNTPSGCNCPTSMFSGNSDHVEFFLPKLGLACQCKKDILSSAGDCSQGDPTALDSILRPWQMDFLATMGVTTAKQLLTARKRDSRVLAKALKKYRTSRDMKPVTLKSCFVALHIWARTAKITLRTYRPTESVSSSSGKRRSSTRSKFASNMEISVASDRSVSTLGDTSHAEL